MTAALRSYVETEQPEDLHRFRVQVKKLRAFFILSDSAEKHQVLTKHFKPVRAIFKEAGEIRNIFMNLELGKAEGRSNKTFIAMQQQQLEKASAAFKTKGDEHLETLKTAYQILKTDIKPVSDLHINLYFQDQLQQIAKSLSEHKFDEQLHACRKLVKILIYNYKFAYTALVSAINIEYLDQVQTAIGNWHDNILATALFMSQEAKDTNVISHLKKQEHKLKKEVTSIINDFGNRATTVVELPLEQVS